MTSRSLLVGDIGGTNARFALANPDKPGFDTVKTYKCADYVSANLAIARYLEETSASNPAAICIAAAGPIVGNSVQFTNNNWQISANDLRAEFQVEQVQLLNDFEAIAYAIPWLEEGDLRSVGLPAAADISTGDFSVGIIGPGTGLGAAGLRKRGDSVFPIVGEGGHVGFAPETQLQVRLHDVLRTRFDRVSDERLVSGPGIENIFSALNTIDGRQSPVLDAAGIFAEAAASSKSTAAQAVQVFYEVLGQVAGNLALSMGGFDGIYIGGGIVQRNPDLMANSRFRNGFEMKGRYRPLLEKTPTSIILHQNPGLLGASFYAMRMLQDPEPHG